MAANDRIVNPRSSNNSSNEAEPPRRFGSHERAEGANEETDRDGVGLIFVEIHPLRVRRVVGLLGLVPGFQDTEDDPADEGADELGKGRVDVQHAEVDTGELACRWNARGLVFFVCVAVRIAVVQPENLQFRVGSRVGTQTSRGDHRHAGPRRRCGHVPATAGVHGELVNFHAHKGKWCPAADGPGNSTDSHQKRGERPRVRQGREDHCCRKHDLRDEPGCLKIRFDGGQKLEDCCDAGMRARRETLSLRVRRLHAERQ